MVGLKSIFMCQRCCYMTDVAGPGFISKFLSRRLIPLISGRERKFSLEYKNISNTYTTVVATSTSQCRMRKWHKSSRVLFCHGTSWQFRKPSHLITRCQRFHDYFVTHLPSSSLHPDSRSSTGPHHKLPRSASTPHTPGSGPSPAAAPPMIGTSRELTVVRIPLRSAKHHFGVSVSRGTRPYNEDTYQAGTIEMPAFAKKAPISLTRNPSSGSKSNEGQATSAEGASGDPQVFYFGIFDGHGGSECSEFLREELHTYIENAGEKFKLKSSLKATKKEARVQSSVKADYSNSELSLKAEMRIPAVQTRTKDDIKCNVKTTKHGEHSILMGSLVIPAPEGESNVIDLELSLTRRWRDIVGGYFRRFNPEYFSSPSASSCSRSEKLQGGAETSVSVEKVLMYAFLRADLEFVAAQISKPDQNSISDLPLNNDEVFGEPSRPFSSPYCKKPIGGRTRFKGGSTASVAMISTPTPTPFWHPATPSTLVIAHVGDTRILICETSTGLAVPLTTNHHPSSPMEGARLRRYAGTFVTDSFGEERMSGLANTRSFGDMHSKKIGVSAEPELRRYELGPAQYSFMVLISDGVSGTLTDQEIVDVVKESKTPDQGARDVVSFATEVTKEGDNATCLVVRLGGWERRAEGGMGSLGTKETRDFRRQEATDPRSRRR